ncbi:hypothetical protein [Streptomyces sp. NPDC001774]
MTAVAALALGVAGCSSLTEEWNDAPAVIGSMPDGFANWAEKCDESGNLLVTTKDGSGGGKVVTMLHLPKLCPKPGPPLTLGEILR